MAKIKSYARPVTPVLDYIVWVLVPLTMFKHFCYLRHLCFPKHYSFTHFFPENGIDVAAPSILNTPNGECSPHGCRPNLRRWSWLDDCSPSSFFIETEDCRSLSWCLLLSMAWDLLAPYPCWSWATLAPSSPLCWWPCPQRPLWQHCTLKAATGQWRCLLFLWVLESLMNE